MDWGRRNIETSTGPRHALQLDGRGGKNAETAFFNFVSKLPLMPWNLLCADKTAGNYM